MTCNVLDILSNLLKGVSLAVAKAAAAHNKIPLYRHLANLAGNKTEKMLLPVPVFNVINGGSHAGNKLAMQEFMLFPHGAANFTEAMKMVNTHIYDSYLLLSF